MILEVLLNQWYEQATRERELRGGSERVVVPDKVNKALEALGY